MDNYELAEQFSLLARLMDIHGENPFKSKSYASAAFALEKYPQNVAELPAEKIHAIKGIGASAGSKVTELLQTGSLGVLQELTERTPPGVLEMMAIKGLGPKKIHTLWKELGIDTLDELSAACHEGRIAATKGFGDKTAEKIIEGIQFHRQNAGNFLYAQLEPLAEALTQKLQAQFPGSRTELTGPFRRQCEVMNALDWVTTIPAAQLESFLGEEALTRTATAEHMMEFRSAEGLLLRFHLSNDAAFIDTLFRNNGSDAFLQSWQSAGKSTAGDSEEAVFAAAGLPYVPPYLREKADVLERVQRAGVPAPIGVSDIRGLIHSHSNWSDGAHTIEEMARELIGLGFEYLVLSDHSKAAYYANGLDEERIRRQHAEIDALNGKLAPFKIYKSIECDILGDGTMDYSDEVLASFDLVIASIHSNLDMTPEKAMMRLMGAITNPYVTIMGHLTGRLLARRKGYPVDHEAIIEACARHNVVIEINSSPSRLDMDWRFIDAALDRGVLLSINPDAHSFEDFHNLKYGVKVAQKSGLTPARNLSSFSRAEFEAFLQQHKAARRGASV
ncbi:helix-hairpin-helix domain-containing protein [Flaviaesturariibacter amylovorans]|uniref:Helix-hairpin-helix domain-containing protein n=1 Tax=Flaviaesturariibacter amylovorans TaxID=1084520 RepID=A0ABP8GZL5_9BACT